MLFIFLVELYTLQLYIIISLSCTKAAADGTTLASCAVSTAGVEILFVGIAVGAFLACAAHYVSCRRTFTPTATSAGRSDDPQHVSSSVEISRCGGV